MLVCLEHTSHCTVATPWVLTAELAPAGASDTLLELLMARQSGDRLRLAEQLSSVTKPAFFVVLSESRPFLELLYGEYEVIHSCSDSVCSHYGWDS